MSTLRLLSVVGLSVLVGCSAAAQDDAATDDSALSDVTAPLSPIGKNVAKTLLTNPKLRVLEHKTWEISANNELPDGWLLPTFGAETWGPTLASLPTGTDCAAGEASCDADFLMRTCDTDSDCPSGSCQPFGPTVTRRPATHSGRRSGATRSATRRRAARRRAAS